MSPEVPHDLNAVILKAHNLANQETVTWLRAALASATVELSEENLPLKLVPDEHRQAKTGL